MPNPVDNSEKNPDGTPKDNSQDYTSEYVERLKEQNKWSAQEVKTYQELVKVQDSDDNSYLLELHEDNPDMATKVAEKMGYDIDEALNLVNEAVWWKDNTPPATLDKEEIIKEAVSRIKGESVKSYENKFFSDLPENIQDGVKSTYKEIAWTGVKTMDQAKKFLDMAKVYANKDNKTPENDDNIISYASLWLGNASSNNNVQKEVPESTQKLAEALWMSL